MNRNELLELTKTARGAREDAYGRYGQVAQVLAQETNAFLIMQVLEQVHRNGKREAAEQITKRAGNISESMDALDDLALVG